MTDNETIKISKPTKRRCGRCAFARMSDNKILNPHREVDMCNHPTLQQPARIISLKRCPKKIAEVFNTYEDRQKGEFEG